MKVAALDGLEAVDEKAFLASGTVRELEPSETLFEDGEESSTFAIVESGSLDVYLQGGVKVATLGVGEEVGAMGALSGVARSATLRASEAARVRVFDAGVLRGESGSVSAETRAKILSNLVRLQAERVRSGNTSQLAQLQAVADEQHARLQLGSFLAHILALMALYGLTMRAGMGLTDESAGTTKYTVLVLLAFAIGLLLFIKRSGESWKAFGITLEDAGKHSIQAVVWSLPLIAVLVAAKWLSIQLVPAWEGSALFSGDLLNPERFQAVFPWALTYAAFVPAQEFVARGALQGGFQRFLAGTHVGLRANILANLMFSTSHAHVSPLFSILVLIPGFFWGWMFSKQGSLLGVTVSHILIGVFFIFVLGMPGGLH